MSDVAHIFYRKHFHTVIKNLFLIQTSLCNTAIDNPMRKSRTELIRGIIHFLETDTVR